MSAGRVTRALERIAEKWRELGAITGATLRPGLTSFPDTLPREELRELYAFADGMEPLPGRDQIMPGFRLLSFAEASALRRRELFPLMTHDASTIWLSCTNGQVVFTHRDAPPILKYDELATLFEAIAECWATSAYVIAADENVVELKPLARQIYRKHNRGLVEATLAELGSEHFDWGAPDLFESIPDMLDTRAVPALVRAAQRALASGDRKLAHAPIALLSVCATEAACDVLLDAAKDPQLAFSAIPGLAVIANERAVQGLLRLLEKSREATRAAAAYALGSIRRPEIIEHALRFIESRDAELRMYTARLLGRQKDPRGFDSLARALIDREPAVAYFAAEALGELGDRRATPLLLEALERGDDPLASSAAAALTKLADPNAAGALLMALADLLQDARGAVPSFELAGQIAAALHASGWDAGEISIAIGWLELDPSNAGVLRAIARSADDRVRVAFHHVFDRSPDPALLSALEDNDQPWSLELLSRALSHENTLIRAEAARVLGRQRRIAANGVLAHARGDPSPIVRFRVEAALARVNQNT